MSNAMYDVKWREAQRDLDELLQVDSALQSSAGPRERSEARRQLSELYARYIRLANELEDCYDQIVQPQKRPLLRRLLDACLGRVLELKHELVEVELSEQVRFEPELLIRLEATPEELELRVPRYFHREREAEIESRRGFIEETLRSIGKLEVVSKGRRMTELEAIRLIQAHERARQGRMRFQFIKELSAKKERSMTRPEQRQPDEGTAFAAALLIQRVWRGWLARRKIRQRKLDEMLLIGMLQPCQTGPSANARKLEGVVRERYERQLEFRELCETRALEAKERIRAERAAAMEESIRLEVRNWIGAYYRQTGKIPELPSAESGGSRMIFGRHETESSLSKHSTGGASSSSSRGNHSKKSSSSASRAAGKRREAKSEPEEAPTEPESEFCFRPAPSNFQPELVQACQEYRDTWLGRDESANLEQGPDLGMIEAKASREIEDEVRLGVDQTLRADIEALQAALDRDRGLKPGKRAKKSQKRTRRSGKKSKRKKEKDLTPDRTTESLFEELLQQGVIKLYPEVRLEAYRGQRSFFADTEAAGNDAWLRSADPLPAIGDVRQIVSEYCVLPLGSDVLRDLTPLVRSVLIAGPRGSGKRMLVNAVCTELGATLFDLTPANLAGKYPGKSGLVMLLHLVSKVSRLLQPSVILMEAAEKPFVKKIPKTDKSDPKRLKKDLPKLVKGITGEDRVILIGITRCPWEADQKLLYQTYDRVIFVPRPDYGSMSIVWKGLLCKYAGISRQFDTSEMTKISDGYTIGTVMSAIDDVMTTKRMVQLRVQPLRHIELINALSTKEPVYREEEDAFANWYSKTPTCKKKQKAVEMELAKLEEANEKSKKKAKRKP